MFCIAQKLNNLAVRYTYFDLFFRPAALFGASTDRWPTYLKSSRTSGIAVLTVAHFSLWALGRGPRPIHNFR